MIATVSRKLASSSMTKIVCMGRPLIAPPAPGRPKIELFYQPSRPGLKRRRPAGRDPVKSLLITAGPPLGFVEKVHGGGYVTFTAAEQRNIVALILRKRGDVPARTGAEDAAHSGVVLGAPAGQERRTDAVLAPDELPANARRAPVSGLGEKAAAVATHPTPEQDAIVGVGVAIHLVPIEERAATVAVEAAGGGRLDAQVPMGQAGKARQVDAGTEGGAPGRSQGRGFVVGVKVGVERDPTAGQRGAPANIEAALTVARIDRASEGGAVGEQVADDRTRGEAVDAGAIEQRPARE